MRLAPAPTPSATSSTTCDPRTHACDTPGHEGIGAVGVFVACAVGLLLFALVTSRRGGS